MDIVEPLSDDEIGKRGPIRCLAQSAVRRSVSFPLHWSVPGRLLRQGPVIRKSKFNETQIVEILKDAESGVPVADRDYQVKLPFESLLSGQAEGGSRSLGRVSPAGARGQC